MKYPIGIQTFNEIIEDGYVYVDKTALIYQLITQGKWYFLSRPRRFGKSLLVSTLEALFQGNKASFEGLSIYDTDYAFEAHPVVKLEFTVDEIMDADSFRAFISRQATTLAAEHQIHLTSDRFERQFHELVTQLHQQSGKKVVVLIDEYDKPLLNTLETEQLLTVKSTMNAFYSMLKSLDQHLKFVFVTGVSKFSKVSIFSGMNNLFDISMNRQYATLCGYTETELENYFGLVIDALAENEGQSPEAIREKIKHWYNGYCFHRNAEKVYNPHSILSLIRSQEFSNFWFQSATPTFLVNLLKNRKASLDELEAIDVGESAFYAVEPEQLDVYAVLLQTGYLTITGYHSPLYRLGLPNKEVRDAFYESLAASYASVTPSRTQAYAVQMHQCLNQKDVAGFFGQLKTFLANVSYEITLNDEKYYQSLFFVTCKLLGFTAEVEVSTNRGRIDCVIHTDSVIYVIEFKLHGTKEEALQQIKDKQYAQKYLTSDKDIVLLGVEFDHAERNVVDWVEELLKT